MRRGEKMELHHIRKNLKVIEKEISERGYKNDIVICTMLRVLKDLNKEVERIKIN
jgi:hypothetical protein